MYINRITNISQVTPNGRVVAKVPVGKNAPTYDQLIFKMTGGLTAAHITQIRGRANGAVFFEDGTPTTMALRQSYKDIHTDANFIVFDFTEPGARNGAVEQLLSSIPGQLLADLSFEFDIAGNSPVGSAIEGEMHYRPPTTNPLIVYQRRTTEEMNGAGQKSIFVPSGKSGGKLKRIWIHENKPDTIDSVQLRIGSRMAYETTREKLEFDQVRNKMVPQAGVMVMDFIVDGNLSGMLDTSAVNEVELDIFSSAANKFTIYYEFIKAIGS